MSFNFLINPVYISSFLYSNLIIFLLITSKKKRREKANDVTERL